MSEVGPGSGVDLVKQMQPKGNLENTWIMFNHVNQVRQWTTMVCHVYDSTYRRVMTIACCNMQSEDNDAQMVFWKNPNASRGLTSRDSWWIVRMQTTMPSASYTGTARWIAWPIKRGFISFTEPSPCWNTRTITFLETWGNNTWRCATIIEQHEHWPRPRVLTMGWGLGGYLLRPWLKNNVVVMACLLALPLSQMGWIYDKGKLIWFFSWISIRTLKVDTILNFMIS